MLRYDFVLIILHYVKTRLPQLLCLRVVLQCYARSSTCLFTMRSGSCLEVERDDHFDSDSEILISSTVSCAVKSQPVAVVAYT